MTLGIIDINDAGVQVAVADRVKQTSPGFAVLDGDRLMVGEPAMRNARLLPRWTNNRFWNQLNTDPIPNGTHHVRHHADLAFAHLESLWLPVRDEVDQVILLVPAYYEQPQLGLLLGMARECDIPVAGVADTSLIVASDQPVLPRTCHLDIHLHRITLSVLNSGNSLVRKAVSTITETGLFTLWDRWANIIANQFIQSSRFDPLHQAESEQALFDQLPDWIASLDGARSKAFELSFRGASHQVSISTEQLMAACTQVYPQIVQFLRSELPADEPATLLLSHRFSGFPGLRDSLDLMTHLQVIELAPDQSIQSALAHADGIIPGNGVISHVISLPLNRKAPVPQPVVHSHHPTHLLLGHEAMAIGSSFPLAREPAPGAMRDDNDPVCTLYRRGSEIYANIHVAEALTINGSPANDHQSLHPGDVIAVNNTELTLIRVA